MEFWPLFIVLGIVIIVIPIAIVAGLRERKNNKSGFQQKTNYKQTQPVNNNSSLLEKIRHYLEDVEQQETPTVRSDIERKMIEKTRLDIIASIDPSNPQDASEKLELVKKLDKLL